MKPLPARALAVRPENEELARRIAELVPEGLMAPEIAERLGIPDRRVLRIARRAGIDLARGLGANARRLHVVLPSTLLPALDAIAAGAQVERSEMARRIMIAALDTSRANTVKLLGRGAKPKRRNPMAEERQRVREAESAARRLAEEADRAAAEAAAKEAAERKRAAAAVANAERERKKAARQQAEAEARAALEAAQAERARATSQAEAERLATMPAWLRDAVVAGENPVRAVRLHLELRQSDVADRMGLAGGRSCIAAIELGRRRLTPRMAERLAKAMGVKPAWFNQTLKV